jgi:hypothetical protein
MSEGFSEVRERVEEVGEPFPAGPLGSDADFSTHAAPICPHPLRRRVSVFKEVGRKMGRMLARMRGSLRLARGRCPSCLSEAADHCGVCLGHRGPFPVGADTLARWRYDTSLAAASQPALEPVARVAFGRHA